MSTATLTKPSFQVTIDRDPLLALVGLVRGVVDRKSTIPITNNLKLAVEGGLLEVVGTDLTIEMAGSVEAAGHGAITVNAEQFGSLLSKLPSGASVELTFEAGDPRLKLKTARSTYQLPTLPAQDFPQFAYTGLGDGFTLDTDAFLNLLGKVAYAQSAEETRTYMNGLYLHSVRDGSRELLRAVATDGKRLAVANMDAPEGYARTPGVIIPRKTVREIVRLLDTAGEEIKLQVTKGKVRIETKDAALTSKVIDGAYPPYDRVIPKDAPNRVLVDRALLLGAAGRAMTMVADGAKPLRLEIEPGGIRLSLRNIDGGQGEEDIEADYDGPGFTVGYNGRWLIETLGQIGDPVADIRFPACQPGKPSLDPTMFLDQGDKDVLLILMPLIA